MDNRNATVLLRRLSGLSPFLGDNDAETLANVAATDWDFDDPTWDDISDLAKDFLCRLMVKDKSKRMSASEALQHPWITVRFCIVFSCRLRLCVECRLMSYKVTL